MKLQLCWMFLVVCLMLAAGCGLDGPVPSTPKQDASAATRPAEPNAAEHSVPEKKTPEQKVDRADTDKSTVGQKPGTIREAAAVGMGEKGRGYGGNMITMPVKAMWTAREKIVLDQIRHALDLYKATEGHTPRNHKEFMERIIKENHLQLPALPTGHNYVYDPEADELMVERPDNL